MRHELARHPGWWLVVSAVAALGLAACGLGGPGHPDTDDTGGRQSETLSRTVVVLDGLEHDILGRREPLVIFSLDLQEAGTVDASLSWSVVSPGTGPYGATEPELTLALAFSADVIASSGASTRSPLTVSGFAVDRTHNVLDYELEIGSTRSCGGCTIQFTLTVTHPRGQVGPGLFDRCREWAAEALDVHYEVNVSPPQPRLRVGERSRLRIVGDPGSALCSFAPSTFHVERWVSTRPEVATVQPATFGIGDGHAVVTAVSPGQTDIFAVVVRLDGSRAQADLLTCTVVHAGCTPINKAALEVSP